jgi:hypothetical protein
MNGIAHLHASSFSKESIWTHSSDLAARSAPELCKRLALETTEGAGKAGRRLTPMVRVQQESTRQNHSCSRNRPAFPAQWFYGLYVISPVTRLCCHRHPRDAKHHRDLAPASHGDVCQCCAFFLPDRQFSGEMGGGNVFVADLSDLAGAERRRRQGRPTRPPRSGLTLPPASTVPN